MTINCPNCKQSVLPDDTSCWHCGAPLTPVQKQPDEQETAAQKREEWLLQPAGIDALSTDVKPSPTVVYTLMTAVVITAAFLLLSRLSQPPLVQVPVSHILPAGWSALTIGDYDMTVELPDSWETVEVTTAEQQRIFTEQLESAGYGSQPLLPFSRLYDDLTLRFYAYKNESIADGPFMLIVTSDQLQPLPYEEVDAAVEQNRDRLGYTIFQQEIIENANRSHYALGIAIEPLRCRQQLITGRDVGIILAICTPQQSFTAEREVIEDIYASFEYFSPALSR